MYMSRKGDLYFANVEERDSRNDYCCFAAFPRLRTIVQKMPMKLTVNSCESKSLLFRGCGDHVSVVSFWPTPGGLGWCCPPLSPRTRGSAPQRSGLCLSPPETAQLTDSISACRPQV